MPKRNMHPINLNTTISVVGTTLNLSKRAPVCTTGPSIKNFPPCISQSPTLKVQHLEGKGGGEEVICSRIRGFSHLSFREPGERGAKEKITELLAKSPEPQHGGKGLESHVGMEFKTELVF